MVNTQRGLAVEALAVAGTVATTAAQPLLVALDDLIERAHHLRVELEQNPEGSP